MNDVDRLWIWDDPATASSLGWYRAVASNRKPAKFRIARAIPAGLPLAQASEDELWDEIERLTPLFLVRRRGIREADEALGVPAPGTSLLELYLQTMGRGA